MSGRGGDARRGSCNRGKRGLREGQWSCGEPMGILISPTSLGLFNNPESRKGERYPWGKSKELLQAGGRRGNPASSRGRAGINALPRACWVPLPVPPTWPSRSVAPHVSPTPLLDGKHQRGSELQHEGRPPGSGPEPRLQERRLSQASAEASPQRPAGSRRRAWAGGLDFHPSSCCLFPPSTAILKCPVRDAPSS